MTEANARYDEACALLPPKLREAAGKLSQAQKAQVEELRLRIRRPMGLTVPGGEMVLDGTEVGREDLELVLDRATGYARYTARETLRQGYLTAQGGFRVGVCGSALPEGEENRGMVDLSSLAIRIPHVCQGVAEEVLPQLFREGRLESALILSPPGGGKTTLLRDLARLLGDGTGDVPSMRLALVDERGELAAMHHGVPQLPVGRRTDVLDGCPKALAVPMLLRAMNPQVIALDELALPSDVEAVTAAAGCGAVLLATVHAASVEELKRRSIGPALLEVFHQAVIVSVRDGKRCYRVEEL